MAVPPPRLSMTDPTVRDPEKAGLRAALRARRDGFVLDMTDSQRAEAEARAADHGWHRLANARSAAFYIALGSELSCAPLIASARAAGIAIALPHVRSRAEPLRFLRWDEGVMLESGWFGLVQPPADSPLIAPDIIFAPLLGFDSGLWRIGQGAGFYDRAFADHPDALRIGYAWSCQQVDEVPRDPWDERLHAMVTEAGYFEG